MKIAIRADASLEIGSGHVMRCLTLADALVARGDEVLFICREHPGNLCGLISARGYPVARLPSQESRLAGIWNLHASWLGTDLKSDAEETIQQIQTCYGRSDWLIVDHYALEVEWQKRLRMLATKIMVIDDLADRSHDCDLLLDQTLGRESADYDSLVPTNCQRLCGSQYALLRPEFAKMRPRCKEKRAAGSVRRLLVSMGGVDSDNLSCQILDILRDCPLPDDCQVTLVLGATAPWLSTVRQQAGSAPFLTEVRVDVKNMAQLMFESDLAIGAAGSSAWERCCLGLPTVMIVVADNQRKIADSLARHRAAIVVADKGQVESEVVDSIRLLLGSSSLRLEMSQAAMKITDGEGVNRILGVMGMNHER